MPDIILKGGLGQEQHGGAPGGFTIPIVEEESAPVAATPVALPIAPVSAAVEPSTATQGPV